MEKSNTSIHTNTVLIPQEQYLKLMRSLDSLSPGEKIRTMRHLCRTNLYFLIRYVCNRSDFDHPWLYARCNEVQDEPFGYLDLWSRDHRKSTIITFAHTIFEILRSHGDDPYDPEEVTVGIFSHTRPIAKSFLRQIMRELESNKLLQQLFPDILYAKPDRDAPTWSEDSGIVVRRKLNPKESTVEAHGLVDGQPVGKHFNRLVYDDVVTLKSVATSEMIQKTTDAWALSLNLGTETGKIKHIGTRYHYNDTYKEIIARKTAIVRLYAGTEEGTLDGTPVLLSPEAWRKKVRDMGTYVASCQLLNNPQPESSSNFKEADLRFYRGEAAWEEMNRYIIVDPANKKKKKSDYTSMQVIGLGADENYYVLAMYRDKLGLNERTDLLFKLHRKYRPLGVYYEEYGMQSDVSHIEYVQERVSYRFDIQTFGGSMAKHDRIRRLLPITEAHRLYLPQTQFRTIYDGTTVDVVERFLEDEYKPFPIITDHDDALDCLSRIADPALDLLFPELIDNDYEDPYAYNEPRGSWMAV